MKGINTRESETNPSLLSFTTILPVFLLSACKESHLYLFAYYIYWLYFKVWRRSSFTTPENQEPVALHFLPKSNSREKRKRAAKEPRKRIKKTP